MDYDYYSEYVDHRIKTITWIDRGGDGLEQSAHRCLGCGMTFDRRRDAIEHVEREYYEQHRIAEYRDPVPDPMVKVRRSLDRILSATRG